MLEREKERDVRRRAAGVTGFTVDKCLCSDIFCLCVAAILSMRLSVLEKQMANICREVQAVNDHRLHSYSFCRDPRPLGSMPSAPAPPSLPLPPLQPPQPPSWAYKFQTHQLMLVQVFSTYKIVFIITTTQSQRPVVSSLKSLASVWTADGDCHVVVVVCRRVWLSS